MKNRKINWADICVSLALYALSVFVFVYSSGFKKTMDRSLNPSVWPRIICALLCLMATIQLVNALRGKVTINASFSNFWRVLVAMAMLIAYALLLKKIGFIVCSLVLMIGLLLLFDVKKKWIYVVLPVVTIALVYYLFKNMLRVPLPKGILKNVKFLKFL